MLFNLIGKANGSEIATRCLEIATGNFLYANATFEKVASAHTKYVMLDSKQDIANTFLYSKINKTHIPEGVDGGSNLSTQSTF